MNTDSFGKWRRRLWPVHSCELWKLLPLLLMKFCVSFNYTILFSAKDTVIVTAPGSGAEVIPILKGSVVLIFAFIATLAYSRASDFLSRRSLFLGAMIPFALFFVLYGFYLYPNKSALMPNKSADAMLQYLGHHHWHWVAVWRNWMHSLFFVASEMWGAMVISVLFWGFANQINELKEAKRFYALLSVGGHIGTIIAGRLVWHYSTVLAAGDYTLSLQYMMATATIVCLIITAIYLRLESQCYESRKKHTARKKKNPSFSESLSILTKSPHLGYIALMVIGYCISVNMVEVTWKALLKIQYPTPNEYQAIMGGVTGCVGALSFILALFVSGNTLRVYGWRITALSTPYVLTIFSAIFYITYAAYNLLPSETYLLGTTPLLIVVVIGAIHNVVCKAMKYCLFDPTREMAYLSLEEPVKVKGKAAVDVIGTRLGKSGSSWVQAGMLEIMGTGSILQITHCLIPFVVVAFGVWIISTKKLGPTIEQEEKESPQQLVTA